MNKYRDEFKKESGYNAIGKNGTYHSQYSSWLESKLEQAEKEKKELVELLNKIGGDLVGLNLSESVDKGTINVITAAIYDAIQKNSNK